MRKKLSYLILFLLALLLCFPAGCSLSPKPEASENTSPALWKISAGKHSLYIFASVSLADESIYPLPSRILEIYDSSDVLAVEHDLISFPETPEFLLSRWDLFRYADGSGIQEHIPLALYKQAKQSLKDAGLYDARLEYTSPMLWTALFRKALQDAGPFTVEQGIEFYFLNKAKQDRKSVLELYPMETQYPHIKSASGLLQQDLLTAILD